MAALAVFILVLVALSSVLHLVTHYLILLIAALVVTIAAFVGWRLILAQASRPVVRIHRRYVTGSIRDVDAVRRARRRQYRLGQAQWGNTTRGHP